MRSLVFIFLMVTTCFTAFAQNYDDYSTGDKAYVGVNLGFGMFSLEDSSGNSIDINSPNIALVVGRHLESIVHIEGVFGMSSAGDDSYSISGNNSSFEYSNMFAFVNYGINIAIGDSERFMLSPKIGVGFIKSTLELSTNGFSNDKSDVSFIWQLGSSMRFMISEGHSLELTALYVGTNSPEYDYVNGTSIAMNSGAVNVSLGYRFWFY